MNLGSAEITRPTSQNHLTIAVSTLADSVQVPSQPISCPEFLGQRWLIGSLRLVRGTLLTVLDNRGQPQRRVVPKVSEFTAALAEIGYPL